MFTFSFSSFHFPNVGHFRIRFLMLTPQPVLTLMHFWWKEQLKMAYSASGRELAPILGGGVGKSKEGKGKVGRSYQKEKELRLILILP